jgi:hypothetical protein
LPGRVFSPRARFNLNSRPFSGAAAIIPAFAMTAAASDNSEVIEHQKIVFRRWFAHRSRAGQSDSTATVVNGIRRPPPLKLRNLVPYCCNRRPFLPPGKRPIHALQREGGPSQEDLMNQSIAKFFWRDAVDEKIEQLSEGINVPKSQSLPISFGG